jgi:hypothetical protein
MTGQDFPEMGRIDWGNLPDTEKIIKDSGTRREFETGAVRDMSEGKGRFDILPYYGIEAVARLMEQGAKKYGERNCFKGIPNHSFLDSGMRHASKFLRGMADEPHLVMAAWNLLMAVDQQERVKRGLLPPELDDCGVTVDVECGDLIDAPGPHFIEVDPTPEAAPSMVQRDMQAHDFCPNYNEDDCVGEGICVDCDLQTGGV